MSDPTDAERVAAIGDEIDELVKNASFMYGPTKKYRDKHRAQVKAGRRWIMEEVRQLIVNAHSGAKNDPR